MREKPKVEGEPPQDTRPRRIAKRRSALQLSKNNKALPSAAILINSVHASAQREPDPGVETPDVPNAAHNQLGSEDAAENRTRDELVIDEKDKSHPENAAQRAPAKKRVAKRRTKRTSLDKRSVAEGKQFLEREAAREKWMSRETKVAIGNNSTVEENDESEQDEKKKDKEGGDAEMKEKETKKTNEVRQSKGIAKRTKKGRAREGDKRTKVTTQRLRIVTTRKERQQSAGV